MSEIEVNNGSSEILNPKAIQENVVILFMKMVHIRVPDLLTTPIEQTNSLPNYGFIIFLHFLSFLIIRTLCCKSIGKEVQIVYRLFLVNC